MGLTNELCDLPATGTLYPVAKPRCPNIQPGGRSAIPVAAVLVHYVQGEPDRVTFCAWFIRLAMVDDAYHRLWDTQKSINGLRRQAKTYSTGNGAFDMTMWRGQRQNELPRSRGLPDIDVSVGFDTFLTSVVGRYSLGLGRGTRN